MTKQYQYQAIFEPIALNAGDVAESAQIDKWEGVGCQERVKRLAHNRSHVYYDPLILASSDFFVQCEWFPVDPVRTKQRYPPHNRTDTHYLDAWQNADWYPEVSYRQYERKRHTPNRSESLHTFDFQQVDWLPIPDTYRHVFPLFRRNRSYVDLSVDLLILEWLQESRTKFNQLKSIWHRESFDFLDWLTVGWDVIVEQGLVKRKSVHHDESNCFQFPITPYFDSMCEAHIVPQKRRFARVAGYDLGIADAPVIGPGGTPINNACIAYTFDLVDDTDVSLLLDGCMGLAAQQLWEVTRGAISRANFAMSPIESVPSGAVLQLTIRSMDNEVLADATSKILQSTLSVLDLNLGLFQKALSTTDTDIKEGDYKWDVWRTDAGNEKQLARGVFRVRPQVRTVH